MGNKSKKLLKKQTKEQVDVIIDVDVKHKHHKRHHSTSDSKPHPHPHPHPHPKPHCGCEQLFYAPLPNLAIRPPTERIAPIEWFAPGSVQSCCSICSSVKPTYATPCTGYCCNGRY